MMLNVSNLSKYSISFLIIFGIGLGILIGIALISYLVSKIGFIKKVFSSKKKWLKIILYTLYGLITGFAFGFFSLVDYWQRMPVFTFVNFSLLAIFAYRYSLWVFLGAAIPESIAIYLLYDKLMPQFANNTFSLIYIAYICFAYLIFIFIGSILKVFNTKNKTNLIFLSSFVGFICLFFIIWLVTYLNDGLHDYYSIGIISLDVLFSFFTFLFYYVIYQLIINFFKSYADILQSGNFAEPGIPNQKYGVHKIANLIVNNNIKYGFLITLKLLNEEEIIKKHGLSSFYKIRKLWNNFLIDHFPFKNYLEFINKNNDYCLFIGFTKMPINIDLKNWYLINQNQKVAENNLNILNDYLEKMPKYVVYNNQDIQLMFRSFISLYNVHSCKIDELIHYNYLSYLTNQKRTTNQIYLFNPSNSYNPYANFDQSQKLDELIHNQTFDIKFKKINEKTLNNQTFYYSDCINLNMLLFNKNEVYDYARNAQSLDIFQRYLSALILNKASKINLLNDSNNYLLIDYPWSTLNQVKINITPYLLKIKNLNLNPNNIILTFDLKEFDSNIYCCQYISQSLLVFQENGFKIAFMNVDENNLEIFKYFIPNYSFFTNIIQTNDDKVNEYYETLFSFLRQKEIEIIY